MAHAASSQSIPIVTAYDSLREHGLRHSLVQTGSKAIFLDPNLLPTLTKALDEAKSIQSVIYNTAPEPKPEDLDKLKSSYPALKAVSFHELGKRGGENPVDPGPPSP